MPPKRFPDASKMPPNRVQDASKPQENRQDGLRSLKDMGKTLHDASQTAQQPPNDTQDASKTIQSESKTPWHRLKINYVEIL